MTTAKPLESALDALVRQAGTIARQAHEAARQVAERTALGHPSYEWEPTDETVRQLFSLADRAYGIVDQPFENFQKKPTAAESYHGRGLIRRSLGNEEQARADLSNAVHLYDEIIAHSPKDTASVLQRGLIQQDLGAYEAAIHDYTTVIDRWSIPKEILEALGRRWFDSNSRGAAQAHFERAQCLEQVGKADLAVPDYELCLALFTALDPSLWSKLGYREADAACTSLGRLGSSPDPQIREYLQHTAGQLEYL